MTVMQALSHVTVVGTVIAIPAICGYFDNVNVDTGTEHYAEVPWPYLEHWLPWLPMPANTIVNLGYIISGIIWLSHTNRHRAKWGLTDSDAYYFYVFAWMAVLYGGVQTARILSQNLQVSILDQWYTLPIFSWICTWCSYILYGHNRLRDFLIVVLSSASYCLSLPFWNGFEIALGVHVIAAISIGFSVLFTFRKKASFRYFVMSILCCGGFLFLKLSDHYLPTIHPLFFYLSGHFWSKIADFLQFHYVSSFFASVVREKRIKYK